MKNDIQVRLFGVVQVERDGLSIKGFESRKALGLFCYLLAELHPVPRTTLIDLFWPDKPEARGKGNLSRVLNNLSTLFPDCLVADRHTVQFASANTLWVDTIQFELLAKESNLVSLTAAVDLYRGNFLEGMFLDDCPQFETWIVEQQEYWRQQVADCIQSLITHHVKKENYDAALHLSMRLIQLNPWREEAHRIVMVLQALTGQKSAALLQYNTCKKMLEEELAVTPSAETIALYEAIQSEQIDAQAKLERYCQFPADPLLDLPDTFPQPSTPFVGRESELSSLTEMLQDPHCRLLTITGLGGIGKTRLAIQAAYQVLDEFKDGVYFISLASAETPQHMVMAVAQVVKLFFTGAKPLDAQLAEHLKVKNVLLVLDNYEQLLPHVDLISLLLAQDKRLKLLVTSRERLHLQDEWVFALEGLPYPASGAQDNFESYDSVRLFAECARKLNRRFVLSPQHAPDIARICQQLQGLPLGIELAVTWTRTANFRQIAEEIEKNIDFLFTEDAGVDERHRSISAVFDYSWARLSPQEQDVFAKLSVFQGGFTQDAASFVADADLHVLSSLLDQSLLQRAYSGRYKLHTLLGQFGHQKLKTSAKRERTTRRRHSQYYTRFLQQRNERLKKSAVKAALDEIQEEIDNVRAAWRWSISLGDHTLLNPAVESLVLFYDKTNRFREGEALFDQSISAFSEGKGVESLSDGACDFLEKLLSSQGRFCFRLGLYPQSQEHFERALALSRRLKQPKKMALALTALGNTMFGLGRFQEAKDYHLKSLELQQQLDNPKGVADALHNLAIVLGKLGQFEEAKRMSEECLSHYRKLDDAWGSASSLNNVGSFAVRLGQYEEAASFLKEALAEFQTVGDRHRVAVAYHNLGEVAFRQGKFKDALDLFQRNMAVRKGIQDRLGVAGALCELGEVYHTIGRYASSKRCINQALAISKEIGDQSGTAVALNLMATLALRFKQVNHAKALAQQSADIAEQIDNPFASANALLTLGKAYGTERAFDRALGLIKQGLDSYRTMKELLSTANAYNQLGWLYARAKDTQKALPYLQKGMKKAATLGAVPTALEGMGLLLRAQQAMLPPLQRIEHHAFILHHPCNMQVKAKARLALIKLKAKVAEKDYQQAIKRGKRGTCIERVAQLAKP